MPVEVSYLGRTMNRFEAQQACAKEGGRIASRLTADRILKAGESAIGWNRWPDVRYGSWLLEFFAKGPFDKGKGLVCKETKLILPAADLQRANEQHIREFGTVILDSASDFVKIQHVGLLMRANSFNQNAEGLMIPENPKIQVIRQIYSEPEDTIGTTTHLVMDWIENPGKEERRVYTSYGPLGFLALFGISNLGGTSYDYSVGRPDLYHGVLMEKFVKADIRQLAPDAKKALSSIKNAPDQLLLVLRALLVAGEAPTQKLIEAAEEASSDIMKFFNETLAAPFQKYIDAARDYCADAPKVLIFEGKKVGLVKYEE